MAAAIILPYCLLMYVLAGGWGVAGACVAYIGRDLMFLGARIAVTRSWRIMAAAVGPEALSLVVAFAVCMVAWPAQPPEIVGIIVTAASIALASWRRPAEFDAMIGDVRRGLIVRFAKPVILDAESGLDG